MLLDTLRFAALTVLLYMTFWAALAAIKRRNDLADVAWGLGFVTVAWVTLLSRDIYNQRHLLMATLVTIWGIRLSWHIYGRWKKSPEEDYRYQAMRAKWRIAPALQAYLQVFLLQGVLLLFVAAPILVNNTYIADFSWLDIAGAGVWVFGFIFESVADKQLRSFIATRKNKDDIMQSGLWKYSRHPNYFGEVTQWWGIGLIAASVPFGWLGFIGPLTITFLITKVSGIPLLEKRYAENKAYQEYAKRTPALLPRLGR